MTRLRPAQDLFPLLALERPVRRRRLVQLAAGSCPVLAGCLALPDGGGTATPRPTVSIVNRGDKPDLPVRPSIEVAEADATGSAPPQLNAAVENTADYPVEVGEERAIVFAFVSSDERPGLVLLPADGGYEAVEPGCWRLASPVAIAEYYGVVQLDPGETAERRLGVWGSADGDGCLPTGRFRFETQYAGARDRGEGLEEQEWRGTWGFTLELT